MKNRSWKILLLGIVLFGCNLLQAQLYTISDMFEDGYSDTSDAEDFFIADSLNMNTTEPDGGGQPICREHIGERMDEDIDLKPDDPYILIYNDEFNDFNTTFWDKSRWNGHLEFGNGVPNDIHKPSNNQAINKTENIFVQGGKLFVLSKRQDQNVGLFYDLCNNETKVWDHGNIPVLEIVNGNCVHKLDAQGNKMWRSTPQYNVKYSCARLESKWGFDGNFDFYAGKPHDNEGGIAIESSIKFSSRNGSYPAYWMMSYKDWAGDVSYNEFDMFEFMNSDYNNIVTTMWEFNNSTRCEEEDNGTYYLPNHFRRYCYFWNRFYAGLYFQKNDAGEMKKHFMRHQVARNNRVGCFQENLSKGEKIRRRKMFNKNPMKVNFSMTVNPDGDHGPDPNTYGHAGLEVDYIRIYKQLPCPPESKTFSSKDDMHIRHQVYNVETVKEAIIDFPSSTDASFLDGQIYKIIANNKVEVKKLKVSPQGTFIIEETSKDLCKSEFEIVNPGPIKPEQEMSDFSTPSVQKEYLSYSSNVEEVHLNNYKELEKGNCTIKLFSLNGKLLHETQAPVSAKIKVPKLSPGIYFCVFTTSQKVISNTIYAQ